MSDVQLLDTGDGSHGSDIVPGEAVTGVYRKTESAGEVGGVHELGQHAVTLGPMVGVSASMKLDCRDAQLRSPLDRGSLRVDEEGHANPDVLQSGDRVAQSDVGLRDVEAALGGDLLAALGNQGGLEWAEFAGEVNDLSACGELEIDRALEGSHEPPGVVILDVATIFPQVEGDSICPVLEDHPCRLERVGFVGLSRLSQRGDMIDIDIESHRPAHGCSGPVVTFLPIVPVRRMSMSHPTSRRLSFGFALLALALLPVARATAQDRAPTASAAVEQFFGAASDSNLTRMAQLFGTDKGSVQKTGKPEDYPKRMVVMQAMMGGTQVRALNEVVTSRKNHVVVTTEVAKGNCKVVVPVTAVKADGGWLVREFDLPAIWDGINRPCIGDRPGN